jgi:hypothetical protein
MSTDGLHIEHVEADVASVLLALEQDPEFLLQFFISEELKFPVPNFHLEILELMKWVVASSDTLQEERLAIAIPRGHAKTTIAKVVALWYLLHTEFQFIAYVGATQTLAKAACVDIIDMLFCDNFVNLFGQINFISTNANEGAYVFEINLNGKIKRCILRAIGAGQKMRGINVNNRRPQLAVVDDLEDYDNIKSKVQSERLRKWFYGTFIKALDQIQSKIIMLGNMLGLNTILHEVTQDPSWRSRVYGCLLENGEPLWPDLWPIDRIRKDYEAYKKRKELHIWMAEMMNSPVPEGHGLILQDDITYAFVHNPVDLKYSFITIDPAISKKRTADESAIVVHGYADQFWQPVDFYLGKLDPLELFRVTKMLSAKWGVKLWGIEAVQYQAALQHVFPYLLKLEGDFVTTVVPLKASAAKTDRLRGWCGFIKDQTYRIPNSDILITQQLLTYDTKSETNDDDLIDSCAYGPQMITEYMPLIMNMAQQRAFTENRKPLIGAARGLL